MGWMNRLVAGKAEWGAWPTLYAALGAGISGGDYVGPAGRGRWDPVKARSSAASYDLATAQRLWSVSEQMTGVKYAFKT